MGRFNGTWIEHLEIKMFIATGRISSGETWSSSWIQFVNLRDCERFIQSDLLKSIFFKRGQGRINTFSLNWYWVYRDIGFCLIRQWSEKEHSETSILFMSSSEQKIKSRTFDFRVGVNTCLFKKSYGDFYVAFNCFMGKHFN